MIRFFAAHPTAGNLIMILFIVAGLLAAPGVRRETFPEVAPDEVEIRIAYPGASTEEVEEALCNRIEDAIDGIDNLIETRCEARESLAMAVAVMREDADLSRFTDDVKAEIDAVVDFPDEAEKPTVAQRGMTDFVAAVAVGGPMSTADLKAYAEGMKDRMLQTGVATQVAVKGFSDHQIRIEIPAAAMRQYGLSAERIAELIRRQSVDLPAGGIETADGNVLVRFADERHRPQEFEDLVVVAGRSGAELRLGDIARVSDRFELDEDKVYFNGQRAAMLEVTKSKSQDTLKVIDKVRDFVAREQASAPPDMEFAITRDISSIVRDRLTMLLDNGMVGLGLVFLVMWLFFGLRYSFWVAMGLPVAFLGAVLAMNLIGYTFNMITMVGLLIAIGLMMDDAIVIAENIAARRAAGLGALEAAVDGAKQVTPGVLASFATTIAIFGPLSFITGEIGQILKAMPVVLLVTLAVSLIEAFLILPHHLLHSLEAQGTRPPRGFRVWFDDRLDWVRQRIVGRLVDTAIAWRYLFLGLVAATLLSSIAMLAGGILKFRAFPDIDGDVVVARVLLPQGTPLARTEAIVADLTAALERVDQHFQPSQPEGRKLVRNLIVQYNANSDAFETGPHVATIFADLLQADLRNARIDDILNRWRHEAGQVPDVISLTFKEPVLGPGGLPIDIRLQGEDLDELKAAALDLRNWLTGYRGVHDVTDDLRPGKPEARLKLREGALALGLDAATVSAQLRAAFFGRTAAEIQVGSEAYEVDIRYPESDRDSLADLEYFTVTTQAGQQVPISTVARIEPGRGFARVNRVNGQRTVTVRGDIDGNVANANEVVADTSRRLLPALAKRYPGVSVHLEGQAKETEKTGGSMQRAFMIGLVGIFVLLSYQFRSYIEPVVVMIAIPMALIGVIWGHLLLGFELAMPSMIGFISLSGIVVNDSILVVEFTKRAVRAGASVAEAAALASRQRFRAVLLTSATTIVGLLPLLSENSLQAQVLKPLVTSLTFGLLASTMLVLFVIPAFYTVLADFKLTESGPRAGEN